eukprot:6915423-Pyramimonas_sp.AAC.1
MATSGEKSKLDMLMSRASELLEADAIDADSDALPLQAIKTVQLGLEVCLEWLKQLNTVLQGKETI